MYSLKKCWSRSNPFLKLFTVPFLYVCVCLAFKDDGVGQKIKLALVKLIDSL